MNPYDTLDEDEARWVPTPRLYVSDPYWAGVPVVSWQDGRIQVLSGDLAAVGTSIEEVTNATVDRLSHRHPNGEYGVLVNPMGQVRLMPLGSVPRHDWRYMYEFEFDDWGRESVDDLVAMARELTRVAELAQRLGWIVWLNDENTIMLAEPSYVEQRRTHPKP